MILYNFPQYIRIFIGYQFESNFYKKTDFVNKIKECSHVAKENLKTNKETKNIMLNLESQDFHLKIGEIINHSIHSQIQHSDICIFEVSDNNPNVMYEAGYAIGLGKIIIYVSSIDSLKNIASDLSGIGIATYNSIENLNDNLIIEIEKAIIQRIKSKSIVDSFWEFSQQPTTAFLGKDNSYFTIGDLKALELIRAKIKYHQNIEIGIEQKFESKLNDNLIIIGGPKSNKYLEKVYNLSNQKTYRIGRFENNKRMNEWYIEKNNNIILETDFILSNSQDIPEKDYAIVHLGRNPYHKKKKWFCFSGLTRIATLESINCFLDEKKLSDILEQISYDPNSDYTLIMEFGVFNDYPIGYKLLEYEKIN
ncbi:hypothetical protein [Flavobacterium sp.]|uniref:hypothetical protein n=1 Tax=Flavobacterium sp. TaxID=239 RepID=UPI002B4B69FC|nr:hypothetical protein [Flavobacterium sp.]HLP63439.1 hypothetical protein [Flavobacterium sp.]